MLISDNIYYCKNCKKVVPSIEDLLFVEDGSNLSFCSEACIEKFYSPLIDYFTGKIEKKRKDLNIVDEPALEALENPAFVDRVLHKPDEIWRLENDLKEEIFTFISKVNHKGEDIHLMAICFVFDHTPSFVLALTATANDYFVQDFQVGEEVESLEDYHREIESNSILDSEDFEHIELKKSKLLAEMMIHRKEFDIPFEDFTLYMDYLKPTIESYDELYVFKDEDDEEAFAYFKAFEKSGVSFFYIALCTKIEKEEQSLIVPIISFPTIDGDLSNSYKTGKLVDGNKLAH
ncbi:hypothetical protein ABMA70_02210 [Halobacteriovorax sp. XZX-3]|uniref:hypothetical protein n=1 Tax=unclassified Halobacteriovorax TaxID=2639665 RepID=UPI003716293D